MVFMDADTALYWVSFLNGLERVLFITEDVSLAKQAIEVMHRWLGSGSAQWHRTRLTRVRN